MTKTVASLAGILLFFCACKTGTKDTALQNNIPPLPPGWQQADSAEAVVLGQKNYTRADSVNTTDYAIIVNLAAGGGIRLLDSIADAATCSPVFNSYSVTDSLSRPSFWSLFHTGSSFAMANLQFFNYSGNEVDTTQVCYPLYYNGAYISQGCADGTCNGDQAYSKRIIIITDTISVLDYHDSTPCNNYSLPANTVAAMVGNYPTGYRSPDSYVARTYIAKQGASLILYNASHARDTDIYVILQKEFNVAAADIVMFDGGGSSQMICKGKPYLVSSDNRWVPSAIEIYSAGSSAAAVKRK